MEVDSPLEGLDASRRVRGSEEKENTKAAIETIEAFVRGESWPTRIQESWERVKRALAEKEVARKGVEKESSALEEMRAEIKELGAAVRGIAKATSEKEILVRRHPTRRTPKAVL